MTTLSHNDGFGLTPIYNNATIIEDTIFQDFLHKFINELKTRISSTSDKLEPCLHLDDVAAQAIEMLNALEVLQMHIEFILKLSEAQNSEEVETIKKNAGSISSYYTKVHSKEDISEIPVKIALAILHDKIILEFDRTSKFLFKKSRYGGHYLVKSADNIALMKIIISRCETGLLHIPYVLTSSKDDIFNFPKSSPLWQDLYKSAVFKSHLSKEEAVQSFKMMRYASNVSHILIRRLTQSKSIPLLQYLLPLAQDAIYYGCLPGKAEIEALQYLINPDPEAAVRVWNLIDTKMAHIFISLRLPKLAFDNLIYIPRLFPAITKDVILQEYKDGTINKVVPMDPEAIKAPNLIGKRAEVLKELLIPGENKVPIRILSPKPLNFNFSDEKPKKGLLTKAKEMLLGAKEPVIEPEEETAIIINLHGGGFIAMSSASMRIYLSRWCKDLNMVCFAVDYRLAPQNPYPAAIDDIWQAYLWILNYSESILGIKNKRIIIAGDSSGGNLAMAITLRILKAGLQPPHACVMIYPCLQLDLLYSSPNSFLSLDDSVIHSNLLKICMKSYVTEGTDPLIDPFLSPVFASDELLEKMPPVRIISGTDDPLQDDNWRMVAKLRKANRDVKMIAHAHLSHGFMCYQDLKGFDIYIKEACELIQELLKPAQSS